MNGVSKIDQTIISEIKNSVDIVDIISDYIPLTGKGKNLFCVCPFHDDHSPSMSVSRDKQIYTCFSCGATGTVFTFLQEYENISFLEALKICADKAGIDINLNNVKTNEKQKNTELYEMYETATKLYQNNINTEKGKIAKKYLEDRQIDNEIIKEFKIGLALRDNNLTKLLTKKKYNEKYYEKSGLVYKNELEYVDSFYDRIMFPIEDASGKVVAFSGRIYKEYTDNKPSKYKNTKETEIFKKGEILYNYHRAKEEARNTGKIIIMEGFMDLFRAYSVGIKNVVVSMGTAVTKEQANLLKRIAKEIILCFDGDQAGEKATYACSNELQKLGIIPKIIRLEENLDPDEYILKYGKDKFEQKINNPINLMEFKMHYLKKNKDLNSSIDMSNYINEVIKELNEIDDDILREITLKKISNESNLDIDFLKKKLDKKETKEIINKPIIKINKTNKYIKAEQYLLYYMLNNKDVIKMYQSKLGYLPTEKYRKLAIEINFFYKENNYINISDLLLKVNDEDIINTIKEINLLNLKDEYLEEEIDDYIKTIKNYNVKYESKRLIELQKMEIDPIKKAEIGQKILEINKLREEFEEEV